MLQLGEQASSLGQNFPERKDMVYLCAISNRYGFSMNLRSLKAFVAVVEEGSFSAAAGRLRIAQPALSLQARKLEEELGCQLLQRLPRGVVATPSGLKLLGHARDLLARADAARDDLRGDAAEPTGGVTIGLPQSMAAMLTQPLLSHVLGELPQVKLRVVESMTGYIPDWVREGRLDLGMVFRGEGGRGLVLDRLLDEQLFLVGPPEPTSGPPASGSGRIGRVAFADLARLPMILPGAPHGLRELIDERARRSGIKLKVVAEVDALAQLTAAAGAGLGWSILSFTTIQEALEAGRVAAWRIEEPTINRSVYLCSPSDRLGTRAVLAVGARLREIIAQLVRAGAWPATLASDTGRDDTWT
ncbi:LysR family transcriptional regulator [Pseudoroseomonas wenyumeiae]|uniref:LysR family transcriptional regulator n=2 Tax=Teichococcus wenyumeiae TaxID=2478470 RepID=A0ABX9VDJ4_9PROT|nr:LysR family transcriptional regulator [Pseudoroseomonas wenyumeiae]